MPPMSGMAEPEKTEPDPYDAPAPATDAADDEPPEPPESHIG